MKAVLLSVLLVCIVTQVAADVYLHSPRGSNNRLNERSANRNNGNRAFDSQNNNKGGYNVGDRTTDAATTQAQQYKERFYETSQLTVEWTNQHGAGENPIVRTEVILQYMCGDNLRNGINTNTPPENADDTDTVLHESRAYYNNCANTLQRNQGLFTADQNLQGTTAKFTRQNPNGNRRGYECPEERDYYPWWNDNPWRDIAILTSEPEERCPWYKSALESLGRPSNIPCQMVPWSRDNHLGNSLDGNAANWNWTLPTTEEACGKADGTCTCVFRQRYNMSVSDVSWFINSTFNGDEKSPLQNNPTVDIGVMQGFKLAINTAQTGRTFQDRSHLFNIVPRPAGVGGKIYNLNVRGKRGNIVQTFPAVEYDFVPKDLTVRTGDWVHIQWTGSNTHNNGNPAGDGQAGDDGQGTGGTDRNNIVEIRNMGENYPMPFKFGKMFDVAQSFPAGATETALQRLFATAGKGDDVDPLLNNANPSFEAPLLRFKPGTYHYMCTRNNNHSNRGQKGTLTVRP